MGFWIEVKDFFHQFLFSKYQLIVSLIPLENSIVGEKFKIDIDYLKDFKKAKKYLWKKN